jgi:hypothetical protein
VRHLCPISKLKCGLRVHAKILYKDLHHPVLHNSFVRIVFVLQMLYTVVMENVKIFGILPFRQMLK